MAKELKFSYQESAFSLEITKVDRKKIYGYTSVTVTDESGSKCSLASVSDDGQHILSKGCVGYTYMTEKNEYVSSKDVKVVDKEGHPLQKIESSFNLDEIQLEEANLEDYLQLSVKSVYQLNAAEGTDLENVITILKKELLLRFRFNYRTDYDADDAFLLQNNDSVFMVIGNVNDFEFLGLEKVTDGMVLDSEDDEDDFDFGML